MVYQQSDTPQKSPQIPSNGAAPAVKPRRRPASDGGPYILDLGHLRCNTTVRSSGNGCMKTSLLLLFLFWRPFGVKNGYCGGAGHFLLTVGHLVLGEGGEKMRAFAESGCGKQEQKLHFFSFHTFQSACTQMAADGSKCTRVAQVLIVRGSTQRLSVHPSLI